MYKTKKISKAGKMVNPASQYTPFHINSLEDGYGALTEIGAC